MTLCLSKIPLAVVEDYVSIRLFYRSFRGVPLFPSSLNDLREELEKLVAARRRSRCASWAGPLLFVEVLFIFLARGILIVRFGAELVLGGERGEVRGSMRV